MSSVLPIRAAVCLLLFALLAAPGLLAPGLLAPLPAARADEQLRIDVLQDQEIEQLLRVVREQTGMSLIWNPADKNIRGKRVTGGTSFAGSAAEVFSQFRAFLTFYELVIVPLGPESHVTYAVMDARQTSSILRMKPQSVQLTPENLEHYAGQDGLFLTTTIEVEHMNDLRAARNALTRIVTGQNIGNVTEVPDAKSFVVTDFAPNVVSIYRLLKTMDKPSPSSTTTAGLTVALDLEHARAAEVASHLVALFGTPPAVAGPRRGAQAATPVDPTAPRIVADGRTNRVLVTGSRDQVLSVKEAIALVDIPVRVASTRVHYVPLAHIRASEAAGTLMALVRSSPTMWGAGPNDPMPSIVSHDETNALLVSATKTHAESLLSLIEQMDQQR